jgi:hypothetical protein
VFCPGARVRNSVVFTVCQKSSGLPSGKFVSPEAFDEY